jgi:hypothetical protein
MSVNRYYSSIAQDTTLSAPITSSSSTMSVGATTGWPSQFPFTLAVDYSTGAEELVDVTNVVGTTVYINRGIDGTSAQSHALGALIRHVITARDIRETEQHISLSSGVHGITGNVVGDSDTQTLTNKTLTGPTITGLSNPTNSGDAANKTYVDGILGSATAASVSAAAAVGSASAASASASSASGSAGTATTQATNAGNSATSASSYAGSATSSANTATTQAGIATTQAGIATTQAGIATTQATNASNSAGAASTSATNASNSAGAASNSATAASGSATSASSSLTSITGLTGAGLVRDMGAVTDADTTSTTYINIATVAGQASTSATNAANSATAAAGSATTASGYATTASTQAGNAATSATAAAASATAASTSASSAATSATSAAASATTAASFIPSQTGNSGKYLTTDGTTASWTSQTTIAPDWGTVP